jgi:phosphoribosylamine--glycine ligase
MDSESELIAVGGRVLAITGTGETVDEAFQAAYYGITKIDWPTGFYRNDIGWRVRSK